MSGKTSAQYFTDAALLSMLGYAGLRGVYNVSRGIGNKFFALPELPSEIQIEKRRFTDEDEEKPLTKRSNTPPPPVVNEDAGWWNKNTAIGGGIGIGLLGAIPLMNWLERSTDHVDFANKLHEVDRLYTEKVKRSVRKKKELSEKDQYKIASAYMDGVKLGVEKVASILVKNGMEKQASVNFSDYIPMAIGLSAPLGFITGYQLAKANNPGVSDEEIAKDLIREGFTIPDIKFVEPKKSKQLTKKSTAKTGVYNDFVNLLTNPASILTGFNPSKAITLLGLAGLANIAYKGGRVLNYNLSSNRKYGFTPGVMNFAQGLDEDEDEQ